MRKPVTFHTSRGFTLVEAMVTVAVVVILAAVAVPNLRSFLTRSGMNAIKDDFAIALQRARLDAINRNTCVSVCQLSAPGSTTCETASAKRGQWHKGWITFENDSCSGSAPTGAIAATSVVGVREPGNPRFMLTQQTEGTPVSMLTFNARGTLVSGEGTFRVSDADDANSAYVRDIAVNFQGRVMVGAKDFGARADSSTAGQ